MGSKKSRSSFESSAAKFERYLQKFHTTSSLVSGSAFQSFQKNSFVKITKRNRGVSTVQHFS